jgi:hypothetical protein
VSYKGLDYLFRSALAFHVPSFPEEIHAVKGSNSTFRIELTAAERSA